MKNIILIAKIYYWFSFTKKFGKVGLRCTEL